MYQLDATTQKVQPGQHEPFPFPSFSFLGGGGVEGLDTEVSSPVFQLEPHSLVCALHFCLISYLFITFIS